MFKLEDQDDIIAPLFLLGVFLVTFAGTLIWKFIAANI